MTDSISFYVAGVPVPEGSTRAFMVAGKPRITHQGATNLTAWRQRIAHEAQAKRTADWVSDASSAYKVEILFLLDRPASVKRWQRLHPVVKPDLDKTARAVLDAITGILFVDDCQVTSLRADKDYSDNYPGQRPGAYVSVYRTPNMLPRPERRKVRT